MKDTKTNSNQIFNRPLRRTTFLGPMIGKLPKSGGSGGSTTYTKSVVYDEQKTILTITNVEDGTQKTPYDVNIPHNAITLYPNTSNPFADYGGLSTHWMKCLISADLSTYTLFFTKLPYKSINWLRFI